MVAISKHAYGHHYHKLKLMMSPQPYICFFWQIYFIHACVQNVSSQTSIQSRDKRINTLVMYIRCAIFSYFNDLWYFLTVWYICKCSRVCTHLKKPKQERYTIASTKNSIGAKCNFSILLIGNSCIADIFLLHSCTRGAPHCKSDCTRQPLYQAPKCISLFVIYTRALSCDKWHNQRAPWSRRTLQTHFPAPTHT
jgi:hypothetical protein